MRVFVAIDVDAAVRSQCVRAVRALQGPVAAVAGPRAVRWVDPASMHLTVRFLGETPDDSVKDLAESLAASYDIGPFVLRLADLRLVPTTGRPRVVWMDVVDETGGLAAVRAVVESRVRALGLPADGRPLLPHLTLGRFRRPAVGRRTRNVGSCLAGAESPVGGWTVDRVIFYESRLQPGGARYRPIAAGFLTAGPRPIG